MRELEERYPLTGLLHVDRKLAAARDGARSGIGPEPAFAAIVSRLTGFGAGDAMLAAVAARVAAVTGAAMLSRRGAEFTVLLPPCDLNCALESASIVAASCCRHSLYEGAVAV